jgi:hypothetical protein
MELNKATFINQIFQSNLSNFDELALQLFRYQFLNNPVYHQYCSYLQIDDVRPESIPFLPVSFFKTHTVQTNSFQPQAVFTSSSTTGDTPSKHAVADLSIYEQSFLNGFKRFYDSPSNWVILALLPSYLEREGSSLVYMANKLIQYSNHPQSGFYLHNTAALHQTLLTLQAQQKPVLLLGVTFALLDFAEHFSLQYPELIVMETGGMKGKRKEMIREEVHELLSKGLGVAQIHSEYGMTELLSQAYSKGNGRYICPPWMRIIISDPNDPLKHLPPGNSGLINIIDLANIDSCAFIQTADLGKQHQDGSFEVLGRLDHSDIRGCSLMYM